MRNKQLIQLLQFVLAWVLLGLFIVFITEKSFIEFILKYWLYLIITSISYFYYYSIEYEPDKKYKLFRNIVVYGNIYLFLHIFFRPLLNISHQLFILLGLIILGIWWTTTLRSKWKYLLQIIGGLYSFFILISGILYFYPEAPDIKGFINKRNNEIKVLGINDSIEKKDAYIKITNSKHTEDIIIRPNLSKSLVENTKITYPSLKQQRDEKIIIISKRGDIIWLFPQSEVNMQYTGNNLIIQKKHGKVGFLTGIIESNTKFIGNYSNLSENEKVWIIGAQDTYKHDLVSYLKNQISDSKIVLANNTIMYNIDGLIIKFLSKMFPATFGKNLQNYNEFQKYFNWVDAENNIDLNRYSSKQQTGNINSTWGNIKDNINIGKNNTYGLFKKPQKQ